MSTSPIVLHRTRFPEVACHQGRPLGSYWFAHAGRIWVVAKESWDGGEALWEVFDAEEVATVGDDYDTLREVRANAPDDIAVWMSDHRAEIEE